jgi:hypothetical protein
MLQTNPCIPIFRRVLEHSQTLTLKIDYWEIGNLQK